MRSSTCYVSLNVQILRRFLRIGRIAVRGVVWRREGVGGVLTTFSTSITMSKPSQRMRFVNWFVRRVRVYRLFIRSVGTSRHSPHSSKVVVRMVLVCTTKSSVGMMTFPRTAIMLCMRTGRLLAMLLRPMLDHSYRLKLLRLIRRRFRLYVYHMLHLVKALGMRMSTGCSLNHGAGRG